MVMRAVVWALSGLMMSWAIACGGGGGTGGASDTGVVVFVPEGATDEPIEVTITEVDPTGLPGLQALV